MEDKKQQAQPQPEKQKRKRKVRTGPRIIPEYEMRATEIATGKQVVIDIAKGSREANAIGRTLKACCSDKYRDVCAAKKSFITF